MSTYALLNCCSILPVAVLVYFLRRQRRLWHAIIISSIAPLLSFPWLYFGINQKAWAHGDAGTLFFNVPLNEVCLAFIMTFLNAGVWLLNYRSIIDETYRGTEAENRTT